MNGYYGKIVIVDLTTLEFEIQDLNMDYVHDYIKGASLGARYLLDLMPAGVDAYAPESVIAVVAGVTNATKALMGQRTAIVSKCPVNDKYNDSSVGGTFGPYMAKTGYDAFFFKGKSEKPVYMLVDDGEISFHNAEHIWWSCTHESEAIIRAEAGKDVSILQIGPAGAYLSPIAALINDGHRAAGRGGSGGIFGSKNLKALVCKGNQRYDTYDADLLLEINKRSLAHGKPGGPMHEVVEDFGLRGTSGEYDSCVIVSDTPIKNWYGTPEELTDERAVSLSGRDMDPKFHVKKDGCMLCHVRCGAIYQIDKHGYKLDHATRPEYESLGSFGSMLMNGDPEVAIILNWLANEYGYDTMSFGCTIAWLMECADRGIISTEEMNGIELKWGDPESTLAVAEAICRYEGIGKVANLGSVLAADALGKGKECTVTAGGIELPQHGSRFNPALARTFMYDPSPGRHIKGGRGVPFSHNPEEVKYNYENTGEADVAGLMEWELINASGVCSFGNFLMPAFIDKEMINAITGFGYTDEDYELFTLRAFTVRQAFNLREGYRRRHAWIDSRAVGAPPWTMTEGPHKDRVIDVHKLGDNFYEAMGWDVETGVPSEEFIERVGGLDFLREDPDYLDSTGSKPDMDKIESRVYG
jgi:aldehyde:ferredoxin oxidoreductase